MKKGTFVGGFDDRRGCGLLRHGEYNTPIHRIWSSMRQRCTNPKDPAYHNYGGRGIKVCDRWNVYEFFRDDMGPRPNGYTLERNDVNGDYRPENCRWATRKEQSANRRNNRIITFRGQSKLVSAWAEEVGVSPGLIFSRLYRGWTVEDALTTPLSNRGQ